MAKTINRRLAELIDGSGQLASGKLPNAFITTAHYSANSITDTKLHTSFSLPASALTARDTGDLSEGSNLYYTDARVGTYISGDRTYGNITTTGYIAGPATFTIDPAAVGDNTGTVVIAGNLQVDGTTTTINSTTLEVDDLNITLGAGSANSGAANGAGITVDIANNTNPTLLYNGTLDKWDFNKGVRISSADPLTLIAPSNNADFILSEGGTNTDARIRNSNGILEIDADLNNEYGNSSIVFAVDGTDKLKINNNGDISFYEDTGTAAKFFWDASGEVLGIGTTSASGSYSIDAVKGIRSSGAAPNFTLQETDTSNQTWLMASYGGNFAVRDTTVSGTTYPFQIEPATPTSTLYLDSTGKVGIGTASPNTNVQIYHATDDVSINVNHGTGGSYPKKSGISFGAISTSLGGDTTFTGGAGIQVINTAAANAPTDMLFFTTSGGSPTERFKINADGSSVFSGSVTVDSTLLLSPEGSNDLIKSTGGVLYLKANEFSFQDNSGNQKVAIDNNILFDTAGVIVLDADNAGVIQLKDGGSHYGSFYTASDALNIQSNINNADINFIGKYNSSNITALTLDMSNAGAATFSGTAHVTNTLSAGALSIPSQGVVINQAFGTGVPSITMTGTANNGRGGAINFKESDGSGGAITNTAAIYSTDGAGSNSNYGGLTIAAYQSDIRFSTGTLAGTKMTVKADGNVGIGTSNPTGKLHVSGGRAGIISTDSSWGQFRVGNTGDAEVGIAYVTGATESDFLNDGNPACAYKVIMGINPYSAGTRNFGIGNDTILNYHTIWTEAGHQLPRVDNTYDLGSSTKGFKNIYLSSDLSVGGHIIGDDDASYMRINASPGGGGAIYFNGPNRTNYQNHIQYLADVHNFGDVDGSPINTLQVISDSELVTINGRLNVTKPIQTTTDTGTRMYTGLATGSHYQSTGFLILDTNIPDPGQSTGANMFSIHINGFSYNDANGGIIDLNIGGYSGESYFHNASYTGCNIPDKWVNNVRFARKTSTNTLSIILGDSGTSQPIEVAATLFIQGFGSTNTSYAEGWDWKIATSTTGYTHLDKVNEKSTKRPSFAAASSGFSVSGGQWQVISDSMSQTHDGPDDNYEPSNGRFTPQLPGWYQFNFGGWATYNSSTGQERYAIAFAKNGSLTYVAGGNYSSADSPLSGAGQRVYLNGSTDYVVLYAYSSVATQWGGSSHWVWWDGYWTGS